MATARPRSYDNTWAGVASAAKAAGALYPDLVAAQWALESGWGKKTSGKNNYFGIKGSGTKHNTQEFEGGKFVTINAEFEDFNSLYDCVVYLVERWYKNWKQYKGVNTAASKEAGARHLIKEGYATDPAYADKLIKLMREHGTGQAGQSQSESHASKPEVMRIEARRATVLKKEMKQAAELGDKGVLPVAAGKIYGVAEYTEVAANAHARVELAGGAGTWYIWGPHWRIVGEPAKAGAGSAVNWGDFNALVTPNVSVGDILQWDKRRIPPTGASVRARLVRTAQEFQRIRDAWGRPLGITSFYRPADINAAVGGVPNSKHILGTAIDVYPVNASIDAFYQWIRQRWSGGLGDGRHKGFIHLDLAAKTETDGHFVPGAGVRPYREWTY